MSACFSEWEHLKVTHSSLAHVPAGNECWDWTFLDNQWEKVTLEYY